jgi:hypothetical protein
MLEKINGEKISLIPKEPKENEKLCDTCGGVGWLYEKEKGYIEKCPVCYNGVIQLCPMCHTPIRGMCTNPECRKIEEDKAENRRFAKAIKSTYDNVPNKQKEMLYSESYGYNEGYFSDIDELIEYCEENESEVPKYVWSTTKNTLSIDACNIVSQACEELHEDAYQNVTDEQELQDFLDKWCNKQSGVDTFMVDYKYAISISE